MPYVIKHGVDRLKGSSREGQHNHLALSLLATTPSIRTSSTRRAYQNGTTHRPSFFEWYESASRRVRRLRQSQAVLRARRFPTPLCPDRPPSHRQVHKLVRSDVHGKVEVLDRLANVCKMPRTGGLTMRRASSKSPLETASETLVLDGTRRESGSQSANGGPKRC